ncbi:hypothetical protein LZ554_000288 [Drepanopeziza brunnea f. sp. 'monogermtubi']|nr:hypothetical protein LZ554_000288 [Drepanopeziza brunnea f. sp. 'monogermtubi']
MSSPPQAAPTGDSCKNIVLLPSELLNVICGYIPRSELKSLRLMCLKLNQSASRSLYRQVFVRTSYHNYLKLEKIAKHPVLSTYIRVISYDPCMLINRAKRPSLEHCIQSHLVGRIPRIDLETLYRQWELAVSDEEAGARLHRETGLLSNIVWRLSGLCGIEYHAKNDGLTTSGLSGITGPFWLPEGIFTRSKTPKMCSQFWTLLQSLDDAGLVTMQAATSSNVSARLSNVKTLKLAFDNTNMRSAPTLCLTLILSRCPALRSLQLEFSPTRDCTFAVQGGRIKLAQFLLPTHQWDRLQSLSLKSLKAAGSDLEALLLRHSGTLRSLELSDIILYPISASQAEGTLSPSGTVTENHSHKGEVEDVGSWLDMIEFLRTSLNLADMAFSGILTNDRNEAWIVTPGITIHQDCLKRRIERYICHLGEENPIIQRWLSPDEREMQTRGDGLDTRSRPVPCIVEDASWRLGKEWLPRRPVIRNVSSVRGY